MAAISKVKTIAAAAESAGFTKTEEVVAFTLGHAAAEKAPASSEEVKLIYFDGPGRGELIRLIFKAGNFKFSENRIPPPFKDPTVWQKLKNDPTSSVAKLFGFIPVLEHGDFSLAQSRAIQSYAADLALPRTRSTARARAVDSMFQNAHGDVQQSLYKCLFGSEESKAAALKGINESLKPNLSALERNIPASGFIKGGDQPSAADLAIFDLYSSPFPGLVAVGADLSAYPKLVTLAKTVGAFPSVAAYVKERGF